MMSEYNPSKRKNPKIKIKQIQQGILEYTDEIGTVLIGIETRELDKCTWEGNDITNKKRELSNVQWEVGSEYSVGNRVNLCPRDIGIFKELLKYLEEQEIQVGDEELHQRPPCKTVYDLKYERGKWKKVKKK